MKINQFSSLATRERAEGKRVVDFSRSHPEPSVRDARQTDIGRFMLPLPQITHVVVVVVVDRILDQMRARGHGSRVFITVDAVHSLACKLAIN